MYEGQTDLGSHLSADNQKFRCNSGRKTMRCSRREFLHATAAGTVALLANPGSASAVAAVPFQLRYAFASSMYGKLPLAEVLQEVRRTGAEYFDLWPLPHANHREQVEEIGGERFGEMLAEHRVKLGILSHYNLGPFELQSAMPFARRFGARILVSNSRGPRDLSGEALKTEVRKFAESMKSHIAAAEENGLVIGIENHSGGLIASPDSLRWLIEMVPSRHLGIVLAPYHLEQNAKMIAGLIEEIGERLVLFYAWQHGHGSVKKLPRDQELMQMPGRGSLDFVPMLRALKKIRFQGWTEIFMHPVPRGVPILDTAAEVTEEINRARRYLDDCLKKL